MEDLIFIDEYFNEGHKFVLANEHLYMTRYVLDYCKVNALPTSDIDSLCSLAKSHFVRICSDQFVDTREDFTVFVDVSEPILNVPKPIDLCLEHSCITCPEPSEVSNVDHAKVDYYRLKASVDKQRVVIHCRKVPKKSDRQSALLIPRFEGSVPARDAGLRGVNRVPEMIPSTPARPPVTLGEIVTQFAPIFTSPMIIQ